MKDHIWKRVLEVSRYISRTKATVRETAKVFDVSKSTVHKDVTERLPKLNPELAAKVKKVLDYNKAERHLRGGEATRRKYLQEERADDAPPEGDAAVAEPAAPPGDRPAEPRRRDGRQAAKDKGRTVRVK